MPGEPTPTGDDARPLSMGEQDKLVAAMEHVHTRIAPTDQTPRDGEGETIEDILRAAHYDGMLTISIGELAERLSRQRPTAGTTGLREFQRINAARSVRWMAGSPGWTVLEAAGELAGEVGELANVCKKLRRSELGVPGNKVSDAELMEQARGEVADVVIVVSLVATKLGIDLEDAVRETFNRKSWQMGFPERLAARGSSPVPAREPERTLHIGRGVTTTAREIAQWFAHEADMPVLPEMKFLAEEYLALAGALRPESA